MESYTSGDVTSSTETKSSPVFSTFSSRPTSEITLATSRSISPFHPDMSSPTDLMHNPDFIPIDQAGKKLIPELGPRPVFESPRPAPQPPRSTRPKSPSIPTGSNESTSPIDTEGDICDEAEDFLQFLSRAAFMAAERRTSSIRRPSILSGSSITESPRNSTLNSRPLSGNSTLDFTSRPSSLIVDSRRTSLALRRGSSGVLPPVLQEDTITAPILEHESTEQPPMQREDHISTLLSQMRMSSDFSLNPTGIRAPSLDDDSVFQARKQSSVDFSNLEVLLSHTKNPILVQLHQVYTAQFEMMASKISSLTNEIQLLKSQMNPPEQEHFIDRQISLDVVSTTNSESIPRQFSRQISQVMSSTTISEHRSGEMPFWKVSLQTAGEEWDGGAMEMARKNSMRCVSPMTVG